MSSRGLHLSFDSLNLISTGHAYKQQSATELNFEKFPHVRG